MSRSAFGQVCGHGNPFAQLVLGELKLERGDYATAAIPLFAGVQADKKPDIGFFQLTGCVVRLLSQGAAQFSFELL